MADPQTGHTTEGRIRLAPVTCLSMPHNGEVSLQLASGETVRLTRLAAEILALCDGTRTAAGIAAESGGSRQATLDFLVAALNLGWVFAHPESRR